MLIEQDLTWPQGADRGELWPVEVDGSPANLTGYTVVSEVRDLPNGRGNLLHSFTASIVETDSIAIQTTAEESMLWDWTFGFYDVILYTPDNRPMPAIVRGTIVVIPRVSLD